MKFCLIFLLFFTNLCKGQELQAELMAGIAGYNGDLTQKRISLKSVGPAFTFNIKYNSGDYINLRAGIGYGQVAGDDKKNSEADLRFRNLSFKTNILEINVAAEVNLFDPEVYTSSPYIFGGIGLFHFNPFTYDNDNKKTFLQPLGTEGQGLEEYPDRKKYALTQLCFPVGLGWKWTVNEKWDVSYEFGFRILLTDYLDDISKTYVSLNALEAERGPKAAQLSYRGSLPFQYVGEMRGNSSVDDIYFFSGIKVSRNIGTFKKRE
ncbi:MAG: DUF6089 family protein [Ginsengibacter sp.]